MATETVSPADRWIPVVLPLMDQEVECALYYVARSTDGGRLIPGSRLSRYFGGPTRSEDAFDERDRLRAQHADAGVFHTRSQEAAERLLAALE